MKMTSRKQALLIPGLLTCLVAVLLIAYTPLRAQASTEASDKASADAAQATVKLKNGHLTASEGYTLYTFSADSKGKSTCYEYCANSYPPYTVEGELVAGEGVNPDKLATIERKNGAMQVTWAGMPLYRFKRDIRPGTMAADGVTSYGGSWSAAVVADKTKKAKKKPTDIGPNPYAGSEKAVAAGEELYMTYGCYGCHGSGGGGGMGPSLIDSEWRYGSSDAALFTTIKGGRPGGMPAWGSHFTKDQIWKIIAFVRSLSDGQEAK